MTAVASERETVVNLSGGCAGDHCLDFSWKLHRQLSNGYTHRCSVMPIDHDFQTYRDGHRTARKRADRAARRGYRFEQIDRQRYAEDIFLINTSTPERQGRPMSAGYLDPPRFSPNPIRCERHHVYTYGVLHGDHLFAYLWLYRCGELAMISSILGHADRLSDDIMYLLVTEAIREQTDLGGTLFYNLHSSGTDGLRYFKERIGLTSADVRWKL